jgi:uncharacterized membrane protein
MTQQPINSDITSDDKLWGALSWFWIIGVTMLLMDDKKNRPFIKYNAILGLALAIVTAVASVTVCLGIAGIIYTIVLAFQAYQGKWVTIPFLSDFVKNQGWVA